MLNESNLKNFENLVISEAEREKKEVLDALDTERKEKIEKYEKELEEKFNDKLSHETGRIENKANEKITAKSLDNKKQYFNMREVYIKQLFANIAKKLAEYAGTDAYVENMKAKIESATSDKTHDYVIVIGKSDEKLIDFAQKSGYKTEIAEKNIIGGCKVVDYTAKTVMDFTFVSAISEEEDAFLQKYFTLN